MHGRRPPHHQGHFRGGGLFGHDRQHGAGGRADEFRISAATGEKILLTAREINYQPNLHARNLRSGTSNIVAMMVPTLTHRFFSGMAEAFERLARTNGLFPLIIATHHDRTEELEAIDYFISQNVDCVFTANTAAIAEVSRTCKRAKLREIVLDAHDGGGHVVTTDSFAAAEVLTRPSARRASRHRKSRGRSFLSAARTTIP